MFIVKAGEGVSVDGIPYNTNSENLLKTASFIGKEVGIDTVIAISHSQIVLTINSLSDVAKAVRLSRKTLRIIKQNLFWAFFYNMLCIPIATGMLASTLGWELNPMLGALAMGISSIFVVTNALRIGKNNKIQQNTTKNNKKGGENDL